VQDERISQQDPEIAARAAIPVPSHGESLDRWVTLAPGTTVSKFVDALRAEESDPQGIHSQSASVLPRVRVRLQMRWVPIWACRRVGRQQSADVRFPGIQISIMDHRPRELLLLSLMRLHVQASTFFDGRVAAGVTMQDLQLDNQLPNARHPVVIGRQKNGSAVEFASQSLARMAGLFQLAGSAPELLHGGGSASGSASSASGLRDSSTNAANGAGGGKGFVVARGPVLAAAFVRRQRTGVDLYLDDGQLSLLPLSLKIDDSLIRGISEFFLEGFDLSALSAAGGGTDIPSHLRTWAAIPPASSVDSDLISMWRKSAIVRSGHPTNPLASRNREALGNEPSRVSGKSTLSSATTGSMSQTPVSR